MIKNAIRQLITAFAILMCASAHAVPQIEGRFIELQNTYDNPIWTTINFSQPFQQPPAVFMLSTNQGGNPAIIRIRNVTTTGFEALPLEPPGEDGEHITMGAHFLAVEYGVHEFDDGLFMDVGKVTLDENSLQYGAGTNYTETRAYKQVNFNYTFGQRPVLVHSLQTLESVDTNPPRDALRPFFTIAVETGSLNETGVRMALEASQTRRGNINPETAAYLAVEPGFDRLFIDDTGKEVFWEALFSGTRIDGWNDGCDNTNFNNNYSVTPLAVASKISRNGDDGGWLRSCRLDTNRLGLTVDEDRDADNERNHDPEEAGIVVMTSNFVYSGDLPSCEVAFPGAVATYANSQVTLNNGVIIDDNNNGEIQTTGITDLSTTANPALCDGVTCVASGFNALTPQQAVAIPAVTNDGSTTPPLPNNLSGDYFIQAAEVTMTGNYTVTGRTRIFIESGSGVIPLFRIVNATINSGGLPSNLSIYVDGNVLIDGLVDVSAYLMATDNINLGTATTWYGAVTAGGGVNIGSQTNVEYLPVSYLPGICGRDDIEILNHYRFEIADDTGSSCAAVPVSLKACANVDCTELYSQPTQVDLIPSTGGNNTWIPDDTVVFNGQTQLSFSRSGGGNTKLGITNPDPSSQFRCFIAGSEVSLDNCTVKFTQDGLVFYNITDDNNTIVTQLSGKPSSTGFNSKRYAVEACGNSNKLRGETLQSRLRFNCGAGQTCSSALRFTHAGNDYDLTTALSNVPLTFDNDSRAEFVLNYPDAGQVSIAGELDVPINANNTNTISGTSNAFAVRPLGFDVSINDANAQGTGPNSSLFRLTGETFPVAIRPVQWQAGDDTNNDAVPDDNASLANNTVAKHYIGEVELNAKIQSPIGGADGELRKNTGSLVFTGANTSVQGTFNYDQVGVIEIDAQSKNSYLGTGLVTGALKNVGRFAPSDFVLANNSVEAACELGSPAFTYMGQPFSEVDYSLQAQNFNAEIMQNYRDGYDKLTDHDLVMKDGATELTGRLINIDATAWSSGVITYLDNDLTFTRDGATPDGAYNNASLVLQFASSQIEGAKFNNAACGSLCSADVASNVNLRYGRLVLDNNFGSELEPLLVPMSAQYWDGSQWALNTADNCFAYSASNLVDDSGELTFSGSGTMSQGKYIEGEGMNADANGDTGRYPISYPAPDWLLWDWDNDGSADDDPSSELQFGSFGGNERIIYWREETN